MKKVMVSLKQQILYCKSLPLKAYPAYPLNKNYVANKLRNRRQMMPFGKSILLIRHSF